MKCAMKSFWFPQQSRPAEIAKCVKDNPHFFLLHGQIFLDYTKEGSSFVFGPLIANIFAFQVNKQIVAISTSGFAAE